MKASEYKVLLTQAVKDSIEKRWALRVENPRAVVIDCPLCALLYTAMKILECKFCPLHGKIHNCGEGWYNWLQARWLQAHRKKQEIMAAKQIITELKAINIDEWVEYLVKKRILKGEK